ncbi:MAG: 3-dehydroquinate synthase, partial [bacterium]|nr:3-dehydroquinate synthase [bacterium]
ESKTPEQLHRLWREMSRTRLRRDSRVVVAGGGSVCDAGAFAASTWMRGVDLTLVPTTLLCMVDASLGGKTAVNIAGEKNQAGTVYPASNIVICTEFLKSLSDPEMINGLAEALKTAVIGNRQIVEFLLNKDYSSAVASCLEVKGRIVAADLEETGERRLLNLGHTLGHCIEAVSNFTVGHGAAVAMGIPVAAEMGENHDFAIELRNLAEELGIPTEIPRSIRLHEIFKHLASDKKTFDSGRIWIIPRGWENCEQLQLDAATEGELLEKVWQ